jgi:hypothetical protein
LEKLKIVAGEKGLAVEQVVQEAIDEFLERPKVRLSSAVKRGIQALRVVD